LDEVNVTLPPEQKVVGPPAVIVGADGTGFTVTTVPADVAVQVPLLTVTEYVPDADTVIDCVVAPFDQVLPVAAEDVKVTLPPAQKVVGPLAVMVGVDGIGETVTVWLPEFAEEHPELLTCTL
jgi:hypothetical protein